MACDRSHSMQILKETSITSNIEGHRVDGGTSVDELAFSNGVQALHRRDDFAGVQLQWGTSEDEHACDRRFCTAVDEADRLCGLPDLHRSSR